MGVRDFLPFFRLTPRGQTSQPIFTQNGSYDMDSRTNDTFAFKIATFHTTWSPGPLKIKICQIFGLRKFSLDLAFSIRGYWQNTPILYRSPMKVAYWMATETYWGYWVTNYPSYPIYLNKFDRMIKRLSGGYRPRAWYMGRYENSLVITSKYFGCFQCAYQHSIAVFFY